MTRKERNDRYEKVLKAYEKTLEEYELVLGEYEELDERDKDGR